MTTKLTTHQAEVLRRLCRLSLNSGPDNEARYRPVSEKSIGSWGACCHLREKGYIAIDHVERGPRGGETYYWVPTDAGKLWNRQRIIRNIALRKEQPS